MAIYRLGDVAPTIHPSAFVHPDAVVIGDVVVGEEASIWPGAVLRGDYGRIEIGARTSIQDGTVVHATAILPTIVGASCVVGHLVHLEGCRIHDHSLVGSGAVVLHRAVVGPHALVGANATVTNDAVVPKGAMALGTPARVIPDRVDPDAFVDVVERYVANSRRYREELVRID
jgi:carbonic anhydrase/acetyltransferase-like protein (isoleucine patch superfamily)